MNQGHWHKMDQTGYEESTFGYDQAAVQQQDSLMDEVRQMEDGADGESPKKKLRPWEKIGPDGRLIKKKPNPAKKNAVFRKALQPKSSVMCLNELQSGLKYVTEPVANIGNFCVSVDVNGQTFRGYGTSKDLAKQAAAEAALVSYVKPPPPKATVDGEPPKPEDDTTPWRTLASFAMYKLFSDWRDGRIGMCNAAGHQGFAVTNTMMQGMGMQGFNMMQQTQQPVQQPQSTPDNPPNFNNVTAHLNRSVHPTTTAGPNEVEKPVKTESNGAASTNKPIKKVDPVAQQTRHPVMILHQMNPLIKYEQSECLDPASNHKMYNVAAIVEGQQFTGQATSIKAAKFQLAKTALKSLYDIDNVYTGP